MSDPTRGAREDYRALASYVAWTTPATPAESVRIGDADCALDEIDTLRRQNADLIADCTTAQDLYAAALSDYFALKRGADPVSIDAVAAGADLWIDEVAEVLNRAWRRNGPFQDAWRLARELAEAGVSFSAPEDRAVPSRDELVEAMQWAWDEFCADTGCFPDCFEWRGGNGTLWARFDRGNFATFVHDALVRARRVAAGGTEAQP